MSAVHTTSSAMNPKGRHVISDAYGLVYASHNPPFVFNHGRVGGLEMFQSTPRIVEHYIYVKLTIKGGWVQPGRLGG